MPTHPPPPDAAKLRAGVRLFLEGLGVDLADPDLLDTPDRVAKAWIDELADGYRRDPADVLSDLIPAPSDSPVIALGLRFVSLCPHHLLPFAGEAHLAYVPGAHIVGLGRLSDLVDVLAHRLDLQERLGIRIAQALVQHLGAAGAGCVLVARHGCMAHRGPRQDHARIITAAWEGCLLDRPHLQHLLLSAAERSDPPL